MSHQRLKYAMVGGGIGAFIGEVHRKAIALDQSAELVAGALSSTRERSMESAAMLGLDPDRSYGSYQELIEGERRREDGVDFVVVVTPNDLHYAIAKMALEHGFHVVVDKPATQRSEEAAELAQIARSKGLVCAVTYNYTGYPMVRQARAMIRDGVIGEIRKVMVEYHQGWLATDLESTGQKQASWRVDPQRAGLGGALGDIGSHSQNLLSFVTGLGIDEIYASLNSFVEGRALDDDATIMLRMSNGAQCVLSVSQICVGEGNGLTIRVYGEKGSIKWAQETPDRLAWMMIDEPMRVLVRGGSGLHQDAVDAARIPEGHPEGYIEAFANIYRGVAARIRGEDGSGMGATIPTIEDGTIGVRFIESCVESAREGRVVSFE